MATLATLDPRCTIEDPCRIQTPAVAVFPELIRENISKSVEMLPSPDRMRPHVKTHKTIELVHLELEAGIQKHKCATIAEAELLAEAGVRDIVLAYPLVGPNIQRFADLQERYTGCSFEPIVDHPGPLTDLGQAIHAKGRTATVLLDLDVGNGRTGIAIGPEAVELYRKLHSTPGLQAGGLHVYDGHVRQSEPQERSELVQSNWQRVREFNSRLESEGLPVPRIVCGGSPSYPAWAKISAEDARIECSPGTFFLNDWNYYQAYEDLPLRPAVVLLTRVISKPLPGRLTLDAGTKAVASDPPLERRVKLLDIPDAKILWQNEEHLILETTQADHYEPGDLLYAWPGHICPTCALHRELLVVENHHVIGTWSVLARDRRLNC